MLTRNASRSRRRELLLRRSPRAARSQRAIALCGAMLSLCGACGKGAPSTGGQLVQASTPRIDASSVPAADVQTQAEDNGTFACALYAQLATTPGNLFFSPYSVSSALAMTWAGAAGDTATGIASALDFSMPAPRVQAAFDALGVALASRAQTGSGAAGGPFQLEVANALWAQAGMQLEQPFLDTLASDYGAGVRLEPFATAPEPSRADINAWVSDNTDGRVAALLGPGTITADTLFVLTNAVYFSGAWATPFPKANTQAATFHALDGSTPSVQMMQTSIESAATQGNGFIAAEVPYSNPDLTLTLLVPDPGNFATIESQLDSTFLNQVIAAESPTQLALGLPKFTASTQASLKAPLTALGMGAAFSPGADFSGINGALGITISDVIHQANVSVDENGTEAAAATAVIGVGSAVLPSITLTVDRPFILALRDRPTGSILFLGRIVSP